MSNEGEDMQGLNNLGEELRLIDFKARSQASIYIGEEQRGKEMQAPPSTEGSLLRVPLNMATQALGKQAKIGVGLDSLDEQAARTRKATTGLGTDLDNLGEQAIRAREAATSLGSNNQGSLGEQAARSREATTLGPCKRGSGIGISWAS
ncbi:unnamed protein product [Ilex paraguariensis]|uniref:Uncharacterized protein n=1 Tax=Ilex paraguariensis TaxID=185542 RepID=A0ABC8UUL4_9AQUA